MKLMSLKNKKKNGGATPPGPNGSIAPAVLLAAALVIAIGYAVWTAIPEKPSPAAAAIASQAPVSDTAPSALPDPEHENTGDSGSPFIRTDITPLEDGENPSGAIYWAVSPERVRMYEINVPVGWIGVPVTGGMMLAPEGFDASVEGSEPIEMFWTYVPDFDELKANGAYAYVDGTGESHVEDYYMYADADGTEWPVYVIVDRTSEDDGISDPETWRILVSRPSENGLFFVITVGSEDFRSMRTPAVPDVISMARKLFPPSSEPGMPEDWDGTDIENPDGPDETAPDVPEEADTENTAPRGLSPAGFDPTQAKG